MAARRSYGTGSLLIRPDQNGRETWYGKYRAGGRQIMRKIGPKRGAGQADGFTKAQAETRLRELMATSGGNAARVPLTIELLHDRYVANRGKRLKSTTLADYAGTLNNHLRPYFAERSLDSVTTQDVEAFVAYLAGRKLSVKSIENYFMYLATLLNYAVEREWLPRSPARGVTLPEDPDDVDELRFLEAAGIGAFRFHDLRHTFGTQAARSGVPVTTIQAWMGHSDLRTTQRYMHYAPAHNEAAILGRAFAVADPRYVAGAAPVVAA